MKEKVLCLEKVIQRNKKKFEVLREHPYVKIWRDSNFNCSTPVDVYDTLSEKNGVKPKDVDAVISKYRNSLGSLVSSSINKDSFFDIKRGLNYYKEKLQLNRSETSNIYHQLYV